MSADGKVFEVSVERAGRTWRGTYTLDDANIPGLTVSSDDFGGRKYAALHASPAIALARILLGELVDEGLRRRVG